MKKTLFENSSVRKFKKIFGKITKNLFMVSKGKLKHNKNLAEAVDK
jgi:hypothetical protein